MKLKFDTLSPNSNIILEIYNSLGVLVYNSTYTTNGVGFFVIDTDALGISNDGTFSCYAKLNGLVVNILEFNILEGHFYDEGTYNFITSNHDDDFTYQQASRLQSAALLGKSQMIGNVIRFKSIGDTKTMITATVDQEGNRLAVTLDKT